MCFFCVDLKVVCWLCWLCVGWKLDTQETRRAMRSLTPCLLWLCSLRGSAAWNPGPATTASPTHCPSCVWPTRWCWASAAKTPCWPGTPESATAWEKVRSQPSLQSWLQRASLWWRQFVFIIYFFVFIVIIYIIVILFILHYLLLICLKHYFIWNASCVMRCGFLTRLICGSCPWFGHWWHLSISQSTLKKKKFLDILNFVILFH